jgi:hypothetical protein
MERNHLKGASGEAINVILAAAGRICQTGSISPPSTTNATPAGSHTASTQGPRAVLGFQTHEEMFRGLPLLTITQIPGTSAETIERHYGHLVSSAQGTAR